MTVLTVGTFPFDIRKIVFGPDGIRVLLLALAVIFNIKMNCTKWLLSSLLSDACILDMILLLRQ